MTTQGVWDRKIEAITELHNELCPLGIVLSDDREEVAERIRKMSSIIKSAKWRDAVESYAAMVEDEENPLQWAYIQGSIYFAHAII